MRRKTGLILGVPLLVILTLTLCVVWKASELAALYKPTIQTKISEVIGGEVQLGAVKLKLLPPAIAVSEVTMRDPSDTSSRLSVGSIEARVALLPLLSKKLSIQSLVISKPWVVVRSSHQGTRIGGIPSRRSHAPSSPPTTEAGPESRPSLDLSIDHVTIRDGSLHFEEVETGRALEVQHIQGDLQVELLGEVVSIPKARLELQAEDTAFSMKISGGSYSRKTKSLLCSAATLSSPAGTIQAHGVPGASSDATAISISSESLSVERLGELARMWSPSLTIPSLKGSLALRLALSLRGTTFDTIEGAITFSDIDGIVSPPHHVTKGTGTINLSGTTTNLEVLADRVTLNYNGAPMSITARGVVQPERFAFSDLSLEAFDGTTHASPITWQLKPSPGTLSSQVRASSLSLQAIMRATHPACPDCVRGTITSLTTDIASIALSEPATSAIASGSIVVSNGIIKGLNIPQQLLSSISGLPFLSDSLIKRIPPEFERAISNSDTVIHQARISYALSSGTANISELSVASDLFNLAGSGTYSLSGELSLDAKLSFAPDFSRALTTKVPELKGLMNSDDRLVMPMMIRGHVPSVIVVPDISQILQKTSVKMLESALEGALKGNKKDLKKTFKNVFGF